MKKTKNKETRRKSSTISIFNILNYVDIITIFIERPDLLASYINTGMWLSLNLNKVFFLI